MGGPLATHPTDLGSWAVSFTCLDCDARLTRFVRAEPDRVNRCFGCEMQLTRRVSGRLLTLVFGSTSPRASDDLG
jgi:hypothetical protein